MKNLIKRFLAQSASNLFLFLTFSFCRWDWNFINLMPKYEFADRVGIALIFIIFNLLIYFSFQEKYKEK